MRDNGAPSIWKSCYKQLSLSYQSKRSRRRFPPRARPRCPPAAAVPRAPPLFWCRSWWRRALGSSRRVAYVRRVAARAAAGVPPPLPSRRPRLFWWGGCARAARDCARCGARYTAGTWLSTATPCGVAVLNHYIWSSTARGSFSSATCAAKKILLGLQTCAPSASGGRRVRCSQAAHPFVKK